MNIFAIERGDERAVQPLNDGVREEVALVLDFLDFVGLVPDGLVGGEHRLEEPRPALQLVGERLEVGVELFFAGNQAEGQSRSFRLPADAGRSDEKRAGL